MVVQRVLTRERQVVREVLPGSPRHGPGHSFHILPEELARSAAPVTGGNLARSSMEAQANGKKSTKYTSGRYDAAAPPRPDGGPRPLVVLDLERTVAGDDPELLVLVRAVPRGKRDCCPGGTGGTEEDLLSQTAYGA